MIVASPLRGEGNAPGQYQQANESILEAPSPGQRAGLGPEALTVQVVENSRDIARVCRELPQPLGLVPTMGALHEGHLTLVRRAKQDNEAVVVSIFINPAQFGAGEDLDAYPRNLPQDLDLLRREGAAVVFTPTTEDIYPPGFDTWVDPGSLGEKLEGAHRPGHFRGVATVVAKLFNLGRPRRAYFGQKDGQQTRVIARMVEDLGMDVEIVVVPTVRDSDGLALSSRNAYLTASQREAAPVVHRALCRAQELWRSGERDAGLLRREVRRLLESEPLVETIDYVSVAQGASLDEADEAEAGAMVSTAVVLGRTRLIDNLVLE